MDIENILHRAKRSKEELTELIAEAKRENEERDSTIDRATKHLYELYGIIDDLYLLREKK